MICRMAESDLPYVKNHKLHLAAGTFFVLFFFLLSHKQCSYFSYWVRSPKILLC